MVYLAVLGYSIAYLVLAFATDTSWWWWFVPFYGTFRIFSASVWLGIAHVGILPAALVSALSSVLTRSLGTALTHSGRFAARADRSVSAARGRLDERLRPRTCHRRSGGLAKRLAKRLYR